MTLKKVNCDYFRYAKEYDVLNDRIFLHTGKRIIILDMEKNFIHEIKG